MPLLNDIQDITFENNTQANLFMELYFFKEELINLFLIKTTKFNEYFNENTLNVYTVSLTDSNLQINTNMDSRFFSIQSILIQKSKKYENYKNSYSAFNIIAYKINGIWRSENYFGRGKIYKDIVITAQFSGFLNKNNNYKNFLIRGNFLESTVTNVDIENLLYIPQKDYIFGFKANYEKKISYIPLLKPAPLLRINVLTKNNGDPLLEFENITFFTTSAVGIDDEITETYINTRTLRKTNGPVLNGFSEDIIFNIDSTGTNSQYYNHGYEKNTNYTFRINVLGIYFYNNYSTKQINNRILISKFTNQDMETNLQNYRNNWGVWGNDFPLYTSNSYLKMKIDGITESRLNILNIPEIKLNLLITNKNSTLIDVYIQNKSYFNQDVNTSIKGLYKNTDEYGEVLYKNDMLEIIPRARENTNGLKASIGIQVVEYNNDLFKDLLIDDIIVEIAGIQSNVSDVIINLNIKQNLGYSTYSTPIVISTINNNFYEELKLEDKILINDDGEEDEYSGKNPIIIDIKQVLELRYKVTCVINALSGVSELVFERLNIDDKSIINIGENDMISQANPAFNCREDEIYIFDTSDISNKGKRLKFYFDSEFKNELVDNNSLEYVEYSRNFEPGEEGSYVKIQIPTLLTTDLQIINQEFYYRVVYDNNSIQENGNGNVFNIIGRKTLEHGEISVDSIENGKQNSGLLFYSNKEFYDPNQIKPKIDISFNSIGQQDYLMFKKNPFNTLTYKTLEAGQLELEYLNTNVFSGDNLIFSKETFQKYKNKFMLKNYNIIDGKIKIGLTCVDSGVLSNHPIFIENNNQLLIKDYPDDINDTEKNLDKDVNNSDFVVYVTSLFAGEPEIKKTDFVLQYNLDNSDYLFTQLDGYRTGTTEEQKYYEDISNNHAYFVGYYKETDNILYVSLIVIKKENGIITEFYKIPKTEMITKNATVQSSSVLNKLNSYKTGNTSTIVAGSSASVDDTTESTNNEYYYNEITDVIQFAFVRDVFDFKIDLSGNNLKKENISNKEIFMFEEIERYTGSINNINYEDNSYLIGFFDVDKELSNNNEKNYINFCEIVFSQTYPYFKNVNNTKVRINNNTFINSIHQAGQPFGLFFTKPSDIVNKYINRVNGESDDNAFRVPGVTWRVSKFELPLFDSNKYCDYTLEIHYQNPIDTENAKIVYSINKRDTSVENIGYRSIDSGEVLFDDIVNYNAFNDSQIQIEIDGSGQIIFLTPGTKPVLLSGENIINKPYKISYQIENYITNDSIRKLALSNNFFNFTDNTGQENTYSNINKTVINFNKINTPLTLDDNETDASKNEFQTFMQTNSINTVLNKQTPIKIFSIRVQDIDFDSAIIDKVGLGKIRYYTNEFLENGVSDPSGAYNNIYGTDINFNVVDVETVENLNIVVVNERQVNLSWDFINTNLSVDIIFKVYRSQNSFGTSKAYVFIGSTTNKYFKDTTAIPYITADYKVESVITWKNEELISGFQEKSIFICENNNFPDGRYDNTSNNPKLYQKINNSCRLVGQEGTAKTSNLFLNSFVLTKKQMYAELSRAKFRPFR